MHGTYEVALAVAFFIGDTVEESLVVIGGHLLLREVHQDDDTFLLAGHGIGSALAHALGTTVVGLGTADLRLLIDLAHIGGYIGTGRIILYKGAAVVGQPVMSVLIAHKACLHGGAVGQGEGAYLSPLGWNSTGADGHQRQ